MEVHQKNGFLHCPAQERASEVKIIAHRRNSRSDLDATREDLGVEVDLRSNSGRLITGHDPFSDGEDFEFWLEGFRHSTLIVNVKEEGIEEKIVAMLAERKIEDFFFLDLSFPRLVKLALAGEKRTAVRVSEFESIETGLALAGKVNWTWVDSFERFSLSEEEMKRLRDVGFKSCLVSPELQGRDPSFEVPELLEMFDQWKLEIDAVCTKRPVLWGG